MTVSGPGGVGKTRLALEVAHRAAEGFGAVWFAALEHVPDPNDLMGTLLRVMGLPEIADVEAAERVLGHLRERRLLLVLDNVEHLLDGATLIGDIAGAGPDVRVLVTSQAPLRVPGEHVLALDPLPVPSGSERELPALQEVPSVALLLDRATAAGTGVELTEQNRFDVAVLCRQLEGLPLALELAASRLRALGPDALSRRLEHGLVALDPDVPVTQRGLRAILEDAVGILAEAERDLLPRLATFSAGFTAALAQAAFGDVTLQLRQLVEAGLVWTAAGGRFEVRPPVRRFATNLLDAAEVDAAHGAISDALVAIAEPFEKRWVLTTGEGRLALSPEADNIFAELDWASLMDHGRHVRLAASTGWWMSQSGAAEQGQDHLEIALARTGDPRLRARCLQALGTLGLLNSDPSRCLDAADAWRDLGDDDGEFYSAIYAAHLYGQAQEGEAQAEVVERCAQLAAATPDDPDKQWLVETMRAEALGLLGHREEALEPLLSCLKEAPAGSWREFWIATRVADLELALHRFGPALAYYGTAITALETSGTSLEKLAQATMIAVALLHLDRVEEAATAWAICELGYDELSWRPSGALNDGFMAIPARLGDALLAGGRRRGAEMGMEAGLVWVGGAARGDTGAR